MTSVNGVSSPFTGVIVVVLFVVKGIHVSVHCLTPQPEADSIANKQKF
jgi:hypothetical protein